MFLNKNCIFTIIFLLLSLGVTVESRNAFYNIAKSHKKHYIKYSENYKKNVTNITNTVKN